MEIWVAVKCTSVEPPSSTFLQAGRKEKRQEEERERKKKKGETQMRWYVKEGKCMS